MPLIDPVTMSNPNPSLNPSTSSTKPSTPTDLLPTQLSKFIANAHPALLLTTFYLRFPALVSDPLDTLAKGLLPLVVLQGIYCLGCLPAVGTSTGPKGKKKGDKAKAKAQGGSAGAWSRKVFTLLLSLLLTLLTIPLLLLTQILFGAPLTTHLPLTIISSAHMALLSLFPLFYVHGTDGRKWREILGVKAPMDELMGGLLGVGIGSWLGAVPIPLDWDREWQRWPVTVVCGMYGGVVVGRMLGGSGSGRGFRF